MNLELTELVKAHLHDATHGVNAMIDGLTLKTDDAVPDDVGAFYDEYTDAWILEGKDPPVVPSLSIAAESDPTIDTTDYDGLATLGKADGVLVLVLYATRHQMGAQARRNGDYVMRAIRRSLSRLATRKTQAQRTVRGICLVAIPRTRQFRVSKGIASGSLAGLVVAECVVIDEAPE